jgi:hypothetical protein
VNWQYLEDANLHILVWEGSQMYESKNCRQDSTTYIAVRDISEHMFVHNARTHYSTVWSRRCYWAYWVYTSETAGPKFGGFEGISRTNADRCSYKESCRLGRNYARHNDRRAYKHMNVKWEYLEDADLHTLVWEGSQVYEWKDFRQAWPTYCGEIAPCGR